MIKAVKMMDIGYAAILIKLKSQCLLLFLPYLSHKTATERRQLIHEQGLKQSKHLVLASFAKKC